MNGYALFAAVWFVAAAAPGADTTLLVSRAISSGWRAVIPYSLGISLAKIVMLTLAYFGLAAAIAAAPGLFVFLKFFGVAFLLWRAFKMWNSKLPIEAPSREGFWPGFTTAFTVGASNPQALLFYLAVVPQIVSDTNVWLLDALVLVGFSLISAAYALLALPIRKALQKRGAGANVNRVTAVIFVILSVVIATR